MNITVSGHMLTGNWAHRKVQCRLIKIQICISCHLASVILTVQTEILSMLSGKNPDILLSSVVIYYRTEQFSWTVHCMNSSRKALRQELHHVVRYVQWFMDWWETLVSHYRRKLGTTVRRRWSWHDWRLIVESHDLGNVQDGVVLPAPWLPGRSGMYLKCLGIKVERLGNFTIPYNERYLYFF